MKRKTDAEIREAIQHELHQDRRVSEPGLNVVVVDGIVKLSGDVSSWGKRLAAQEVAHRVGGVLEVTNEIRVRPPNGARKSDTEIARAARETLAWNVSIPDAQIQTKVSDGRITLEGRVSLHRERDDAEKAVGDLAGVTGVINHLEVVPSPVASQDLRKAIRAALQRQTEGEPKGIDLDVKDGRVVVRGVVRSWREREAVLGAVKGTPGVRAIDDTIRVDPYLS